MWTTSESSIFISLTGAIDADAVPELEAVANEAQQNSFRSALVDCSDITFFGTPALNLLARLVTSCSTVQLVGLKTQPVIPRMLKAVGLDRYVFYSPT